MITILLVDDQPSILCGLRMSLSLESDLAVIGEAGDGETALLLVPELQPDVVVMDIEMPCMDGMTAASQLRTSLPNSAVVFLSLHDDVQTRTRALTAGAAFVGKHEPCKALPATIRRVARRAGGTAPTSGHEREEKS